MVYCFTSQLNAGSVRGKKPCKSAPPRVSVPSPMCRALATRPLQGSTCPTHSIVKIPLTEGVAKDILLSANEQEIWAVGPGTGHVSFGTRPIFPPCGWVTWAARLPERAASPVSHGGQELPGTVEVVAGVSDTGVRVARELTLTGRLVSTGLCSRGPARLCKEGTVCFPAHQQTQVLRRQVTEKAERRDGAAGLRTRVPVGFLFCSL